MGILAMVDVIIVLAVRLATSMVEVGVEWRALQRDPSPKIFNVLVCCNPFAVSPRGEKVLRPLVRGLFFVLV